MSQTPRQEARKLIEERLTEGSASPKSFQAAIDGFVFEMVQAVAKAIPAHLRDKMKTSARGETYSGGFVHAEGYSKTDLPAHAEVFIIQRADNISFSLKASYFDASYQGGKATEMEVVLRPFDGYDAAVHKIGQFFSGY